MTQRLFSAIAVCCSAGSPGSAEGPFDYQVLKVADDTWAFVEKRMNPVVSGNIVAVIGRDAVLVFDAGHHPPMTRAVIADIKRLTPKPVKYLVISHWHDDHWAGAAEFADAWPGVQVLAHPFTAQLMEDRREKFRGEVCRNELEANERDLQAQVASGKRADGTPQTASVKERLAHFLEAVSAQIAECDQRRYRGVDARIDDTRDLDLGGRIVSIRFLGRGNTAGDLVAYIPDTRTLLTGDLLVYPWPYATESYISEWARVLRRLDALDVGVIVPGHGMPLDDKAYLESVADLLESIAHQARAAWHPGMSADELRARIDLSTFSRAFSHGDPFYKANFDYMMGQSAVNRMWQELSGKWEPEG
ncbi:MAG TPA: MBL fold metallo-hydrolase [Gemmatimonadales bacterium]|nr:MBL fold metallo-hydrolase [Gemmatimonadales bacterium]